MLTNEGKVKECTKFITLQFAYGFYRDVIEYIDIKKLDNKDYLLYVDCNESLPASSYTYLIENIKNLMKVKMNLYLKGLLLMIWKDILEANMIVPSKAMLIGRTEEFIESCRPKK